MATVSAKEVSRASRDEIMISEADFEDAPSEGQAIPAGEVEEVFRAEIGEDGQLSSYDYLRLGGHLSPTGDDAKGKIYVELHDNDDNEVDNRTEVRFIARPKNQNSRTPLTGWMPIRDLNKEDTRQRMPLPPVNVGGNPAYVRDGRILAVEVRNSSTSITVVRTNSDLSVPAFARY